MNKVRRNLYESILVCLRQDFPDESDGQIARLIGVNQQTLSSFRNRTNKESRRVATALAGEIGGQYRYKLALIDALRTRQSRESTIAMRQRQRQKSNVIRVAKTMTLPVVHPQPEVHWE